MSISNFHFLKLRNRLLLRLSAYILQMLVLFFQECWEQLPLVLKPTLQLWLPVLLLQQFKLLMTHLVREYHVYTSANNIAMLVILFTVIPASAMIPQVPLSELANINNSECIYSILVSDPNYHGLSFLSS